MSRRDLPERFEAFVSEHRLLEEGQRVIVGVSGGIDSVVLLHLLRRRYDPIAVHIHHGLREDADLDADFVSGEKSMTMGNTSCCEPPRPPSISSSACS